MRCTIYDIRYIYTVHSTQFQHIRTGIGPLEHLHSDLTYSRIYPFKVFSK
jgi:hypothetical protein